MTLDEERGRIPKYIMCRFSGIWVIESVLECNVLIYLKSMKHTSSHEPASGYKYWSNNSKVFNFAPRVS